MVGDAGGAVVRAADEAATIGEQRQGVHRAWVVLEGAQGGAVVDVEELDGPVANAGVRVLVVGPAAATRTTTTTTRTTATSGRTMMRTWRSDVGWAGGATWTVWGRDVDCSMRM